MVREPRYRRIVIQEGPAVLGYERFREQEERSTFATVLDIVRSVLSAGAWELDEEMLQTFARIFFGAMSSAGESVATAEDPEEAADRVEAAIGFIIAGFRSLAEAGVGLPDTLVAERRLARTSSRRCYFPKVTLPPSCGTSSIQVCPAGTVELAGLGRQLERARRARPWSRCRAPAGRRGRSSPGPCR